MKAKKKRTLYVQRGVGYNRDRIYLTTNPKRTVKQYPYVDGDRDPGGQWVEGYYDRKAKPVGSHPRYFLTELCTRGWVAAGMPPLAEGETRRFTAFLRPVAFLGRT